MITSCVAAGIAGHWSRARLVFSGCSSQRAQSIGFRAVSQELGLSRSQRCLQLSASPGGCAQGVLPRLGKCSLSEFPALSCLPHVYWFCIVSVLV